MYIIVSKACFIFGVKKAGCETDVGGISEPLVKDDQPARCSNPYIVTEIGGDVSYTLMIGIWIFFKEVE
jgi:hypothetical protein